MTRRTWHAARIAKFWLDVTLVLCALGGLFFASALVLAPLIWNDDTESDLMVWVAVGERPLRPVVSLEVVPAAGRTATIREARLVGATGELRSLTTDLGLHVASLGSYVLMLAMVIWVVWSLRQVVRSALDGHPFARANVGRLRNSGILLLVASAVWPVLQYLLANAVLRQVEILHPPISPTLAFSSDPILAGLLLIILATVFSHGADLEDERSLTV